MEQRAPDLSRQAGAQGDDLLHQPQTNGQDNSIWLGRGRGRADLFFRPEYDKSLPSYDYDPKKGLELLQQAGWSDSDGDGILDKVVDGRKVPFRFEIKVNAGNTTRKSVALVLQDELKKHGIAATVRELDWTIFLADVKARKFEAILLGWAMSVNEPDAYQVWHSSQAANKGSNHISFKNARADRILEQYRSEFDERKRIELYREFQQILSDEQPYTFPLCWEVGFRRATAHSRGRGPAWRTALHRLVGSPAGAEIRSKTYGKLRGHDGILCAQAAALDDPDVHWGYFDRLSDYEACAR
jgi:hypothetical protein